MRYLLGQGFTRFVELGPCAALTGFMKRIDKNAVSYNVNNIATLESTAAALGQG
jgi:[acyl-carrier-protein] S-malonyltransferase